VSSRKSNAQKNLFAIKAIMKSRLGERECRLQNLINEIQV
jgi:hypothetical protein